MCLALRKGHLDCSELLLKNGADPNSQYFYGSEINRINILKVGAIKLLLKYGADPNSRDRSGLSPLMKAARNPLGYATVKVLIDYGADVNDIASDKHDYRTILHHSIFSGNVDLIRLLLTSGARYPILNFDKPSPLDIAIISGSPEIVKLLIEFEGDVNHGARSIGLPLSVALTQRIKNKYEIVRLLLDGGANPNSIVVSSTRVCGPPLHDYLQSIHQCSSTISRRRSASMSAAARSNGEKLIKDSDEHVAIVRMMLNYGARVLLVKSSIQQRLGLVRTLETLHDELSLELLYLLIDSAEQIDWLSMSKVIFNCLTLTSGITTNRLNDPSESANITPQTLVQILPKTSGRVRDILLNILAKIKLETNEQVVYESINNNQTIVVKSVLSLKQISRIQIRRHLDEAKIRGRQLVSRMTQMPVPYSLKNYLSYQEDTILI